MENIDFFKFEDKDRDFPIYNNNPPISIFAWVSLFLLFLLGLLLSLFSYVTGIVAAVIMGIPLLYFLNWDYTLLIQKPKRKDILMAVGLFIGYLVYAFLMSNLLSGIEIAGAAETAPPTLMSIPTLVLSLVAEELLKLIPFLFMLRVIYKYSHNRKLAVIISIIFVMIFFAAIHSLTWEMLFIALFYQGLGSIFEIYGYIKTKNLLIPYITHVCTDVFLIVLINIGPNFI